jgi:WXXGXW repeat (2 copies)
MRVLRAARWLVLAALLSLIPASSYAGVFISVGFAPPVLPVYVQPPCLEPGLIWTPGYWAYGDDGYYWVPGAWVPAPYEGALWTPPYWGWDANVYVFHPGYWGHHVGYYGGINYGFGYFGIGFAGGEWRGREFAYNTAVVNVNRTVIRNTYVNETVIRNTTIVHNNHVAYVGGPGGIRHDPTSEERVAMHESHVAPTRFQEQHFQEARQDRGNYFKANNGRPHNVVMTRPLPAEHHPAPVAAPVNGERGNFNGHPGAEHGNAVQGNAGRVEARPAPMPRSDVRPNYQPQPAPAARPESRPNYQPQGHPAPAPHNEHPQYRPVPEPQYRPAPQARPEPQSHPAPQARQESHPAPEPHYRPAPQARPESQSHPAPQPRQESHPAQQPQYRPAPQARPEPQSHSAPQHREESHPAHESGPKEPHR